ncbi:hypothetical protein RHO15_09730 [Utexia brackfieldae]|uniref:hypothetical protein n=1 Tax=Utexia brackfieldae TaxID=3074108 RepID=UPI00370D1186
MFSDIELLKLIPTPPTYKAVWAPIYFEPIAGSGEKFTIAVAAIAESGEYKVKQSIRQHVVKAMYGNKSDQFTSLIDLIISSLSAHLDKTKQFNNWIAPIQGVSLGNIKNTASTDMLGVLRQAVMLTASLSSLDFYSNDDEIEQYSSDNTWSKQVKDLVVNNHPSLDIYFNKSFKVVSEARAAKIFFLSERTAINTERLRPSNIAIDLDRNKARLLDLFAVHDYDYFFKRNTHELIVYRPLEDDPTFSKQQMKRLKDALLTLEEVGDKHSIIVTPVSTPQQALKRIERAEFNFAA